jgi:protein TonB
MGSGVVSDRLPGPVTLLPVSLISPEPEVLAVRGRPPEPPPVEWSPERSVPVLAPAVMSMPPVTPEISLAAPSPDRTLERAIDFSTAIPDRFMDVSVETTPSEEGVASPHGPGEGVTSLEGSEGPHPLTDISPLYPRNARRDGLEGVVTLRADISEKGEIERIEVRVSSGVPSLDEAAVVAVRAATFKPALRGGRPISGFAILRIRFQLIEKKI